MIPVRLFRNAAEEFGYIVVCSYNSKNGPWKYVFRSIKSVWADIQERFSIDKKRVVTTGFSGGARAASLFSKISGTEPAGIIACGAGLPQGISPADLGGTLYYGIIGLEDFNYKEIHRLVPTLKNAGVRYCIDWVPGIHKWPDEAAIRRGLIWMEVDSVLRNTIRSDLTRLTLFYNSLKKYAEGQINSEYYNYGVRYLDSLVRHSRMFLPVEPEEKRAAHLREGKKYVRFEKEDSERVKKEYGFISLFIRVFNKIEEDTSGRLGLRSVLNDLKVPYLLGLDRKKRRNFDSFMARRLLFEIAIKADRSSGMHLDKGNEKKAILFAEIAAETGANTDWYNYRLASVYAFYGKKKKCIKLIKTLKKRGRILIKSIEQDPRFNEMLKDPDFIELFIPREK